MKFRFVYFCNAKCAKLLIEVPDNPVSAGGVVSILLTIFARQHFRGYSLLEFWTSTVQAEFIAPYCDIPANHFWFPQNIITRIGRISKISPSRVWCRSEMRKTFLDVPKPVFQRTKKRSARRRNLEARWIGTSNCLALSKPTFIGKTAGKTYPSENRI